MNKHFLQPGGDISIATIIETVSAVLDVPVPAIKGTRRNRELVEARGVAMWIAREITSSTLTKIARIFGDRDHTSVFYLLQRTDERLADPDSGPALRFTIETIMGALAALANSSLLAQIVDIDPLEVAHRISAQPARNAVAASALEVIAMAEFIVRGEPRDAQSEPAPVETIDGQ